MSEKRFSILLLCALVLLPCFVTVAMTQEAPSKPMDPGWFMDGEIRRFVHFADSSYWAGDYDRAAVGYLEALRLNVDDPYASYQISCCYGLIGKDTLAAIFLKRAWARGYTFIEQIRFDPDYAKVRQSEVFKATVDSLERSMTEENEIGKKVIVESPSLNCYRLKLPQGYDSHKQYPLVVMLHGNMGNADQMMTSVLRRTKDPQCILVSLQSPFPTPGQSGAYHWRISEHGPEWRVKENVAIKKHIAAVVKSLAGEYHPSAVYLLGMSQGGWMAYNEVFEHPELYDGLISICGWMDTAFVSPAQVRKGKKLRALIVHGRQDQDVKYEWATYSRDCMRAAGVNVTFFDYNGGHGMTEEGVKRAFAWIDSLKSKQ